MSFSAEIEPCPALSAQVSALRAGQLSSAELTAAALARIEASQSTLNAFRVVRSELAAIEAEDRDRRLAAGEELPLLGVPVAIKDDTDMTGETTEFGCRGDFTPKTADAEIVRRLRAAGAVIVGKTTTPEFGQWPFTESAATGVTRNPWNLARTPGGSSGGSAAAVAAGIVGAAVGSDGAGSVRIPAAWCGLIGIKPQRGRISTWPEPEAFYGLTCLGPLTRTVADAALLLDVLSGNHPRDRHRPEPPAQPFSDAANEESEPRRLRVAVSLRIPFSGLPARLDPQVRERVLRIARVLSDLGHEVEEEDVSYGPVGLAFMPRSMAGIADWAGRVPDPGLLDPRTRANARTGRLLKALLPGARAAEAVLRRSIGSIFDRADVLLTPTTATPPPSVGHIDGLSEWQTDKAVVAACPYAYPWNVVGWPAINVPAGLTPDGLPVGAQLLGPANSEPRLIALSAQLERAEGWAESKPGMNPKADAQSQ